MSSKQEETISRYQDFAKKVSAKFTEIQNANAEHFQCKISCHECCKPKLSVSKIEKENIKLFLNSHPEALALAKSTNIENPFHGKRCSFLSAQGACTIYEARPLVCRSHGAPLQFKDPENNNFDKAMRFRDVCPLNFKGKSLEKIPAEHVMNLDTLNTLLILLQKQFDPTASEMRYSLTLEGILA